MAEIKGETSAVDSEHLKDVELFKNEILGTGAYGAVCKAKCNQLMCAAKLLYPILFQMISPPDPDREHRQPFYRFEQECQFLSKINHPNIVKYLGTYRDPETNAPVLLMELMDESLTHFLESSSEVIPYHIQVNLSQDIAQALAFLHAKGIIHRDLSSNNVLLTAGGSQAKISDFGMLKFMDASTVSQVSMTTCPGTASYMPPEALNEPPDYTEKLDNFSFGVLLVQIVTRQFPAPSERFETVLIPSPRDPASSIESKIPIPEVERRQAHIILIEPTHPLLPIALDCLKDRAVDRPSSQQLCEAIDELKTIVESSQENVCEQSTDIDKSSVELSNASQQSNSQEDRDILESQRSEHCELDDSANNDGAQALPDAPENFQLVWEQLLEQPVYITGESSAVIGEKAYFHSDTLVYEFDSACSRWSSLHDHPFHDFTLVSVDNQLTSVGGAYENLRKEEKSSNKLYSYIKGKWAKKYPSMRTKRNSCAAVYSNRLLIVVGGDDVVNLIAVEVLNTQTKQWCIANSLPFPTSCPSVSICGEHLYLHAGYASSEVKCSIIRCPLAALGSSSQIPASWEAIPSLPVQNSTLVTVKGHLLAVGGENSRGNSTNRILQYDVDAGSWQMVSEISIVRSRCLTAILPNRKLMVTAGSMVDRVIELLTIG